MRIRRDGTWTHEYPDSSPTLSGELKSSSLDHGEFGQGRYCCTDTQILQAFCGRRIRPPDVHVPAQGAKESLEHGFGLKSRFAADTMSEATG
jgi:hypothetical protein